MLDVTGPVGVLVCAWLLDARLGEPPAKLHPVVWMGRAIAPLKRLAPKSAAIELLAGAAFTAFIVAGFGLVAWLSLSLSRAWPLLHFLLAAYWLWCAFALRGLVRAGSALRVALERHELDTARRCLGSLCSREAVTLTESELAGAAIESLAENASDSVVAPLFFFVLFGVPGAVMYRAVNTLDAMVGYRGRYEWIGKVPARVDDVLNLVPARLTALLLALAGFTLGDAVLRGVRVCWRDAGCTESPNAGRPMAMAAGLLGVRLDKRESYVLGAELAKPDVRALRAAEELVRVAGLLAFIFAAFALGAIGGKHVFSF